MLQCNILSFHLDNSLFSTSRYAYFLCILPWGMEKMKPRRMQLQGSQNRDYPIGQTRFLLHLKNEFNMSLAFRLSQI